MPSAADGGDRSLWRGNEASHGTDKRTSFVCLQFSHSPHLFESFSTTVTAGVTRPSPTAV